MDLARLFDGAPASAIDVVAILQPSPDAMLAGGFELDNASPGMLTQGRLPLVAASGQFHVAEQALQVTEWPRI